MPEKSSTQIILPDEVITNKIYFIRGEKVMLDRDLAELYGVETKYLKRQVRRNILRFPDDFMFELTGEELQNWRSQFGTSKSDKKGMRYPPFAFTETGVAQLSGVLNSERAILINNQIMRVFIKMRAMLADTLTLRLDIETIKKKLENQDKNIELVFSYLDELMEKQENPLPRTQNSHIFSKSYCHFDRPFVAQRKMGVEKSPGSKGFVCGDLSMHKTTFRLSRTRAFRFI